MDGNAVFGMEMLGELFCAIDGAMLTAGATESDLKVGEVPFKESLDMMVDEPIDRVEESEDLAVFFEEVDNGLVKAGKRLELVVLTGIMRRTAIKDIASSVTTIIVWYSFFEGERVDGDGETAALYDWLRL